MRIFKLLLPLIFLTLSSANDTELQILSAPTVTANSTAFRISMANFPGRKPTDEPFLAIYGTIGTATFDLQYKAADGSWYSTGDVINGLGLFDLPISSELELRLAYTAGGSSSISATVINGTAD